LSRQSENLFLNPVEIFAFVIESELEFVEITRQLWTDRHDVSLRYHKRTSSVYKWLSHNIHILVFCQTWLLAAHVFLCCLLQYVCHFQSRQLRQTIT